MSSGPDIGRRVAVLRAKHGFGLTELAQAAYVSKGWLHALEHGRIVEPGATKLAHVARVLRCTVDSLIGGAPP